MCFCHSDFYKLGMRCRRRERAPYFSCNITPKNEGSGENSIFKTWKTLGHSSIAAQAPSKGRFCYVVLIFVRVCRFFFFFFSFHSLPWQARSPRKNRQLLLAQHFFRVCLIFHSVYSFSAYTPAHQKPSFHFYCRALLRAVPCFLFEMSILVRPGIIFDLEVLRA